MPDTLLEQYQAFFRSHELNGAPMKAPPPDSSTLRFAVTRIIAYADAVERLGPLQAHQLQYLHGIKDAAAHILRHALTC
jgi:hypothetical protein